ncbi:phosphoribosylglycinamide formyltransferase [Iocasia frigidifontis]|uniref:Phosphoribosylglycinamide formyltransferase n=1 Tax=Iocasia fonsfrigidae TaxID=2682810 RepID=A0A8A7KK01_9FIRM|nr:phosphoribosylglycinamide formyltransferase [Iocasia fonsfrigidae]QTL98444.1 phosphoribosylglycinamide formyltransferase [Iocasia fonsfrigidae]
MLKIAVLASGRGSNLQSIINSIEKASLSAEIRIVVSDNKDAGALDKARKHNIAARFIEPASYGSESNYEKAIIKVFEEKGIDLVVMAGFMRILGKDFIEYYQGQIMNIHPSLLPSFPGLHAQRQALEYGVKYTGCTVHFADQGMDTGPIILQAVVSIKDNDTEESLANRILEKEHVIYPEAIRLYSENKLQVKGRKVIIKE